MRRSRRNISYEMLGIHEDSDGALIDNREEYGSSTYSSDHLSEENVVYDGVYESMCWFHYLDMKHFIFFIKIRMST